MTVAIGFSDEKRQTPGMWIHHPMDGSLSIILTTKQLEQLLYEKDTRVSLIVDVDGSETEITIKKKEEWNESK
jgi:hypothetical protein